MDTRENFDIECRSLPQLELTAAVAEAVRKSSLTLVGKLISECVLKNITVQMIVKRIWVTQEPIHVDQIGPNMFLFYFKRVSDRDRFWNRRPWTINGDHLALKEWSPEMSLKDFNSSHSTFWIQIHGLPLQFMTKENGYKIGGLFTKVVRCEDCSRKSLLGMKFLRLQVELDTSKPLPTGFFQKIGKGKTWIQF